MTMESAVTGIKRAPTVYQKRKRPAAGPAPEPAPSLPSPSPAFSDTTLASENVAPLADRDLEGDGGQSEDRDRRRAKAPRKSADDRARPEAKKAPQYQQLCLDFGQKHIGPRQCAVCGMSYNVGQADDEGVHKKFHRAVVAGIDFPVLPGEQVVRSFEAAVGGARGTFKILLITGESSKREQKLASEVVEIANQELGAVSLSDQLPSLKTFVCVSADRKAAGCVVAEPIAEGFELLPSSTGSLDGGEGDGACRMGSGDTSLLYRPEPRPAVCGISRIWVSKGHRRYGFGLQLLEAVRSRFIFGCSLSPAQIAFSQPTTAGRRLAERFCGRANFLVYVEQ